MNRPIQRPSIVYTRRPSFVRRLLVVLTFLLTCLLVTAVLTGCRPRHDVPPVKEGTVTKRVLDADPYRVRLSVRYPNGIVTEIRLPHTVGCYVGERYPACAEEG